MNSDKKPSEVTDAFWIYAYRNKGKYPDSIPEYSGKWLIFVNNNDIDSVWVKIRYATENGLLGNSSKVATPKINPNAVDTEMKVICIYTYDYRDKEDVMRIRQEIRNIGILNKIPYKTDKATRERQYNINGNTRISIYYE
jgi:hypothetical protein